MSKAMFSTAAALHIFRMMTVTTGLAGLAGLAHAGTVHASYAETGAPTSIPYGWIDFCGRHPEECHNSPLPAMNIRLTSAVLHKLNQINSKVNAFIQPVSNMDHWGTNLDHWDYPNDGKGDCKVYALYKRKLLLRAGLPRQALLMTIVRDLNGNGHTILMVRTNQGDLILDNLVSNIRSWDETGYRFLKRQAQEDPNIWLSLGDVVGARMTEARN